MAVKALKYAPVPVVGAPSGLGVGGGFEVLAHCDKLVVHSNSVLGLVESAVGVVPSGGGVKESYLRWYQQTGSWDEAAWKCWMNIGYAATGSSPELSARLQYFRPDQDETIMNRDRLLPRAIALVGELAANYQPPQPPNAQLASASLAEKMADFMQAGVDKGDFMPHDKTTAMAIASIMVQSAGDAADVDEDTLYARERAAFISLAKTAPTHQRISSMLDDGAPVRN
jgi:3-hydroxyacyl-CoA dehydrogenase